MFLSESAITNTCPYSPACCLEYGIRAVIIAVCALKLSYSSGSSPSNVRTDAAPHLANANLVVCLRCECPTTLPKWIPLAYTVHTSYAKSYASVLATSPFLVVRYFAISILTFPAVLFLSTGDFRSSDDAPFQHRRVLPRINTAPNTLHLHVGLLGGLVNWL